MTNTQDIASIMATFDWKYRQQDNVDIEAIVNINGIEISTTDRYWSIGRNIASGRCISVSDGISQIKQALLNYIAPFLDLTKLQQPEPFWKPIEQEQYIPKKDGTIYDLWVRNNGMTYRIANCHYKFDRWYTDTDRPLGVEILAYAEIPPCEVQS